MSRVVLLVILLICIGPAAHAQIEEICRDFGVMPSMDSPFAHVPYVYGRVLVSGLDPAGKFPTVSIQLMDGQQSGRRLRLERSGNYCFRRGSSGGVLVVEIDGVEVMRRSLSSGAPQQREDFDVHAGSRPAVPGTVSAKFSRPTSEKTVELYKKAAEAEKNNDRNGLILHIKGIVAIDPTDYIAWAKLGTLYFDQGELELADGAYRKSLEANPQYTPAWINVGKLRVAQKQLPAAVEIFKHAAELDPKSARTFEFLGETYLQAKQGTLGARALNEAIRLDPIGMAECHLLLARLYDLAGAKKLATREYKTFLGKIPDHPDKKKFEKYIKANPE